MTIIIGLGNPGEEFKSTRHNVGFMSVDFFAKNNEFDDFSLEKKYDSLISEKITKKSHANILKNVSMKEELGEKIILAKPQTFMNKSGIAVGKIARSYKLKAKSLIVIHDDIDLPVGKIKIVKNRGSAGHKGVESVIKNVGNKNLVRIRVGIQPKRKSNTPETFVIKKFTDEEQKLINKTIKKVSDALDCFIENGLEKTMNRYN